MVLLGLGSWQLDRLAWKNEIIATRAARLAEPAIGLPGADAQQSEFEFRRVRVRGALRHEREMYLVFAHGKSAGYRVVTGLTTPEGTHGLVDRGFVDESRRDPTRRAAGQLASPAEISGVVRWPSRRGWFTPDNAPDKNFWFAMDLPAMARFTGFESALPFYIQADAAPNPGGWPQGLSPSVEISNPHLHYAITWFALAIALATIYGLYVRRLLRPPEEDAA